MRQDKVIFDAPNPFAEFAKCKELTVVLDENRFLFVATLNSINIVASFDSIVRKSEDGSGIRSAYTIPLSLILPLFKLDTQTKQNTLVVETSPDSVRITYNSVSVDTDIYAPNGLTIHQINDIDIVNSMEVDPKPFIQLLDIFGPSQDNFCNVENKTLFISDSHKCLVHLSDFDYKMKFSISLQFLRLMKSMDCVSLHIGSNLVAKTKSNLLLVTNLTKITDPNVLKDYQFAARLKSDEKYDIALSKYIKHISLAVQSAELSASLDLNKKLLTITSQSNEKTVIRLDEKDIVKAGDFDFFSMDNSLDNEIILNDARLIRSLASFKTVRVKVCPTFLVAKLSESHRLLFNLRRA